MPKLGDLVGKAVHTEPKPTKELVLPWGKIGIEVETEGWQGDGQETLNRLWTHKEDGSLRNNGREFVTRGAGIVGDDIITAVTSFCKWAKARKLSEGYPRAGIHVHLDCTDLDIERGELASIVGMYLVVEHALYGYAGMWRRYCGFCDALTDSRINVDVLKQLLKRKHTSRDFNTNVNKFDRYTGLNLQSLGKFGTLEFRHLRTVYDADIILGWINIILQLKKSAQEWNPEQRILKQFSQLGPTGFAKHILGPVWKHLSPYFDEAQAWAAIDSSMAIMEQETKTSNKKINWEESSPNPILATKNIKEPKKASKDKKAVVDELIVPMPRATQRPRITLAAPPGLLVGVVNTNTRDAIQRQMDQQLEATRIREAAIHAQAQANAVGAAQANQPPQPRFEWQLPAWMQNPGDAVQHDMQRILDEDF